MVGLTEVAQHQFSLSNKTALIAGASRGIGLAIAAQVAHAGARVILASRSLEKLERAAEGLRTSGCSAAAVKLDLTDPASIKACAESVQNIDILINVAGINIRKAFVDYTPEEYQSILQTNLHGLVLLTQKIGAKMIARGAGGKIINIGGMASLLGLPYLSIYGITKSGLAGLTRCLAAEWGRYNIQVNCIAPGFILTDLNRQMWQEGAMHDWLQGAQANPRMGRPEDIGPLAVFLSGHGADYITGQVIAVDGGYSTTAKWPFEPTV
jgi:gluconate 5-dehydrogenase